MARYKKNPVQVEEITDEILNEPSNEPLSSDIEITPNKDFRIVQNEHNIVITAGKPVTVPRQFLQNLVTEKVIDKIPE